MTVLADLVSGLREIVESWDVCVAFEAKLRDAAAPKQPRIGGAVGFMAGNTAVEFPGRVREDKRPRLFGVTIDAGAALRQEVEATLPILAVH